MSREVYYIPANFSDAGRILGLFEIRNVIEMVVLVIPALYLCIALIPLSVIPKIVVTVVIIIPLGGFGLLGVKGDSLSRWIGTWWRWRQNGRLISFRGEVKK